MVMIGLEFREVASFVIFHDRSQTCNCKKSIYWLKRWVDAQRIIQVVM